MNFREQQKANSPIKTYFFHLKTPEGKEGYVYLLCSASMERELYLSMRKNKIPRFAVIADAGEGEPDEQTRFNMERYYGFKHEVEEAL
ncbi:MAG: hypothetical protein U1E36_02880 [Rickettsiales bacterium]